MERLIFHVDVNSAFLSWEATRRVANGEADMRLISYAIGSNFGKEIKRIHQVPLEFAPEELEVYQKAIDNFRQFS